MNDNRRFEHPPAELVKEEVERALREDLGALDAARDATGSLLGKNDASAADAMNKNSDRVAENSTDGVDRAGAEELVAAAVYSNSEGVLCGSAWFETAFMLLDKETKVNWQQQEGAAIRTGDLICTLAGKMQALLAAERTALNFLQLLSGVASRARQFADLLEQHSPASNPAANAGRTHQTAKNQPSQTPPPSSAAGTAAGMTTQILDTRKTLPGLRLAQKYAVRVGGCHNHRCSLRDAIMIKENHILAAGGIEPLLRRAAASSADLPIILEVETLAELEQVLQLLVQSQTAEDGRLRVDVILLDNFKLQQVKEAMHMREESALITMPAFEVSGSVTQQDLPALIKLGVERISIGHLTKDITPLDFSLRFTQP